MKIWLRLTLGFMVILAALVTAGVYSMHFFQDSIEKNIGEDSVSLAEEVLQGISNDISFRVEQISQFLSIHPAPISAVIESNTRFDLMQDAQHYIEKRDEEWKSAPRGALTPFMQETLSNELSVALAKFVDYYKNTSNRTVYGEIFITNKYGALIGSTGRTSDYRQDDELWWQSAKKDGIYIEDVEYDESSEIFSITISIRIEDKDGSFLGVLKAVYNVNEVFKIIDNFGKSGIHKEHPSMKLFLLDKNKHIIYGTESHHIEGGIPEIVLGYNGSNDEKNEESGYFVKFDDEEGDHEVYTHAHAAPGKNKYIGALGWTAVIEHHTDDIFKPVKKLSNILILIFAIAVIASLIVSYLMLTPLNKTLNGLLRGVKEIAKGSAGYRVNIKSNDELGELSRAFDAMADSLEKSQIQIERHHNELESKIKEKTEELGIKIKEIEGTKSATINILEDVDTANMELIETQEQLKRSFEEIKKLDYQKDQFISIAAHELKTPLTSIMGFADLIRKESITNNPELRQKYISIILKDSKRLAELITNILELSRMDLGTLKIAWEKVTVYELIKDAKEQMDIIIKNKGLQSEYILEDGLPSVAIDKGKLIQVISNLINNAVHYTESGKISIKVRRQEDDLLFSVSDTGAGIPEEHWGKIFTRFYQVDSPLTRKIGGTGLGLSISKGFVEAMNGRIWFESEEGKGTTFYFTIPIKERNAKEEKVKIIKDRDNGPIPGEASTDKFKAAFIGKK